MADSQSLVTFLACLCTFLLCVIFLPEITRWSNRRHKSATDSQKHESTTAQKHESAAKDEIMLASVPNPNAVISGTLSQIKVENAARVQVTVLQSKLKLMLDKLIHVICTGMSFTNFFQHEGAPRLFIVYAHDNATYGKAHDRVVHDIIRLMEKVRSKTRSDRRPVLYTNEVDPGALDDILTNQLCLLPQRVALNPVDKVMVCYSEVLRRYCTDPKGRKYVAELVAEGQREMALQGPNDGSSAVQNVIRKVVNKHTRDSGFHHVLTEVALLELRTWADKNPLTIIPVAFESESTTSGDLPFLLPTQHYQKLPPEQSARFDSSERTHKLFFNLLHRIYGMLPDSIEWLQKLYIAGVEKLLENKDLPLVEFERQLRSDVFSELKRAPTLSVTDLPWAKNVTFFHGSSPGSPQIDLTVSITPVQSKLLELLTYRGMDERKQSTQSPYPGTIDWLFKHRYYRRWKDRGPRLLSIRGGPGTGKSTAMQGLLEFEYQQPKEACIILSFFFDGNAKSRGRSPLAMYLALLHQLLHQAPDAIRGLRPHFEAIQKDYDYPFATVRLMFNNALRMVCEVADIRIFVDALDEAGNDEAKEVLADFRRLRRDLDRATNDLSICYSCRYYPSVVVDNSLQIRVEEHNGSGIETLVWGAIQDNVSLKTRLTDEQVERLAKGIRMRSRSVFIAAKSALESLEQLAQIGLSPKQLEEKIMTLPSGLNHLYSQILHDVKTKPTRHEWHFDAVVAIIQWTTFAQRQLTLAELNFALGSDSTIRRTSLSDDEPRPLTSDDIGMLEFIEVLTGELILVKETVDANGELRFEITFPHLSVFEFFSNGNNLEDFLPYFMEPSNWAADSHAKLAKGCSIFLEGSGKLESDGENAPSMPLYDYAAKFHRFHEQGALGKTMANEELP